MISFKFLSYPTDNSNGMILNHDNDHRMVKIIFFWYFFSGSVEFYFSSSDSRTKLYYAFSFLMFDDQY